MVIRLLHNTFNRLFRQHQFDFNVAQTEKILDYSFKNRNLLHKAFKHRSYLSVTGEAAHKSNERLEFLGDAVLDLVVTDFLYKKKPYTSEGELTKLKSVLVSRNVLAEIIAQLQLGKYLLLNRGEEKTGGKERNSNLSNLYESLVGAIYLDGGLIKARRFIYKSLLLQYKRFIHNQNYLNYKSILLEYTQGQGLGVPVYRLVQENGPDHDKLFVMNVSVNGSEQAQGQGKSKKIAEQESACNLLKKIAPQLIEQDI
jgi:ribonuclease-3